MTRELPISLCYIAASILFIVGLKMLRSPKTARKGNLVSSVGMLLAIAATLLDREVISYEWILVGMVAGSLVGTVAALKVKMTAMPEMVALFNGFGGLASLLVGWAEFHRHPAAPWGMLLPVFLAVLIGGITFTGSVIAWGKLSEKISSRPVMFRGQGVVNALLLALSVAIGVIYCLPATQAKYLLLIVLVGLSLLLGVLAVIPIGGGDMPVVISLLNSYSGMAACAAGFVLQNTVLIVAGALVGASGLILTAIMCKAMNRSITNVLFSGFGSGVTGVGNALQGEARPISAEDAYYVLEAASTVVIVPGYGMAVAQAQHVVRELGDVLTANGTEVKYAVHPVAGRMPGHMNVLLAEANVDYDRLVEPGDVNPIMDTVDVCLVIGANDVVNPAARDDEGSPIHGMPIIEVDRARTCFVLKRSMRAGFAQIENRLFFAENTRMLFGDAKESVGRLLEQFKE